MSDVKPLAAEKIEESDLRRCQQAQTRLAFAAKEHRSAVNELELFSETLKYKYKLVDDDNINMETGLIERKKPAPAEPKDAK